MFDNSNDFIKNPRLIYKFGCSVIKCPKACLSISILLNGYGRCDLESNKNLIFTWVFLSIRTFVNYFITI